MINLNGINYVEEKELLDVKEQLEKLTNIPVEKKGAKRFEEYKYIKLVESMAKLFPIQEASVIEEWGINNEFSVTDPFLVCCCIPKTEEAKRLLVIFKGFSDDRNNPVLEYNNPELPTSKFSQEYILKILEILNITDDSVRFTVNKDYPITIENDDFKFILAPRVEEK